jgi:hypothetical protein
VLCKNEQTNTKVESEGTMARCGSVEYRPTEHTHTHTRAPTHTHAYNESKKVGYMQHCLPYSGEERFLCVSAIALK